MSHLNRTHSLAFHGRRGLATGLLWLGLLAAQGCLVPQDDLVFPDLPAQKNQPLTIKAHTPGPDRAQTILVGTRSATCSPTQAADINVTVYEPDVNDATASLWYLDRTSNSAPVDSSRTLYSSSTTRVVTATNLLINQLSTLVDGKRHVLEVFVTDGDFTDVVGQATLKPYARNPDGGAPLTDTAYVDFYLWELQMERCP